VIVGDSLRSTFSASDQLLLKRLALEGALPSTARRRTALIAHERKKDRGLDAYAPPARDGTGRGLACSVSAKIVDKLRHFRAFSALMVKALHLAPIIARRARATLFSSCATRCSAKRSRRYVRSHPITGRYYLGLNASNDAVQPTALKYGIVRRRHAEELHHER
jgi:hypothetical protein